MEDKLTGAKLPKLHRYRFILEPKNSLNEMDGKPWMFCGVVAEGLQLIFPLPTMIESPLSYTISSPSRGGAIGVT